MLIYKSMTRNEIPSFIRWAVLRSPIYPMLLMIMLLAPKFGIPVTVSISGSRMVMSSLSDWAAVVAAKPVITVYFTTFVLLTAAIGAVQALLFVRILKSPSAEARIYMEKVQNKPIFQFLFAVPLTYILLRYSKTVWKVIWSLVVLSIVSGLISILLGTGFTIAGTIIIFLLGPWAIGAEVFLPLYLLLFWYPWLPKR